MCSLVAAGSRDVSMTSSGLRRVVTGLVQLFRRRCRQPRRQRGVIRSPSCCHWPRSVISPTLQAAETSAWRHQVSVVLSLASFCYFADVADSRDVSVTSSSLRCDVIDIIFLIFRQRCRQPRHQRDVIKSPLRCHWPQWPICVISPTLQAAETSAWRHQVCGRRSVTVSAQDDADSRDHSNPHRGLMHHLQRDQRRVRRHGRAAAAVDYGIINFIHFIYSLHRLHLGRIENQE